MANMSPKVHPQGRVLNPPLPAWVMNWVVMYRDTSLVRIRKPNISLPSMGESKGGGDDSCK
jgi:hypothetical protein